MVGEERIYPLIDVSPDELASLVAGPVEAIEQIHGGLTNTLHRVTMRDGRKLAVKHYAGGRDAFDAEVATLTLLHGSIPVPDIVSVEQKRHVLVYTWLEGITLNEVRRQSPAAWGLLAEPLGTLLAWLAQTDATESYELAPLLERCYRQLAEGNARERLGPVLCDTLSRALEGAEPDLAWGNICLVHGDLGSRNVIVSETADGAWQVSGVIDWEATTTGSPLLDLGSLFRYPRRFDATFRATFEAAYRSAGGILPANWFVTCRLLDAILQVDTIADPREMPGVFADIRMLLATLAQDVLKSR